MYEKNINCREIRQGDVIKNIFLPRYSINNMSILNSVSMEGEFKIQNKAIIDIKETYAVVISQCCEFNQGKRSSFSLSCMIPWKKYFQQNKNTCGINIAELVLLKKSPFRGKRNNEFENLDRLREANIIDSKAKKNEALNTFLYEADNVNLVEPFIVDFTRLTSIPMKDIDYIRNNKILELDQPNRRNFQIKLGYYFARPAE